jgi:hypothetical protein
MTRISRIVELYDWLLTKREARFGVVDRIRANAPDVAVGEVFQDVEEAIAAIRTYQPDNR